MVGLSISNSIDITGRKSGGLNPIQPLIDTFKTRVATDLGTFEAEQCLVDTLTEIEAL